MCFTQSDRYCAHTYEYKDIYYIFDVHPIFWGTCRLSCLALTSEAARGDTNAAANQLLAERLLIWKRGAASENPRKIVAFKDSKRLGFHPFFFAALDPV
jgi:hypothetical protein